ncbi:hypothetical protein [Sporomusa aerivorans]|uniref:WapI family immunity protein n=1 Tax=Sporomusa aerivorans TaxID=204936 RepID=UPI00352BC011
MIVILSNGKVSVMISLDDVIRLETNEDSKLLVLQAKYLVQQHYTFSVRVISGEFSGKSHFCFSVNEIRRLIMDLDEMRKTLDGTTVIRDYDSDAFLEFRMLDHGHFEVGGQVGSSGDDHFMTFKFVTDQTAIQPFIIRITRHIESIGVNFVYTNYNLSCYGTNSGGGFQARDAN